MYLVVNCTCHTCIFFTTLRYCNIYWCHCTLIFDLHATMALLSYSVLLYAQLYIALKNIEKKLIVYSYAITIVLRSTF